MLYIYVIYNLTTKQTARRKHLLSPTYFHYEHHTKLATKALRDAETIKNN